MACERPLLAVKTGIRPNGKLNLHFIHKICDDEIKYYSRVYGFENMYVIPCGKCPSCKKAYRRMWSLRCEAEARLYKQSSFMTLTLDNDNVTNEVKKEHLKKFFKDLRNRGISFRYFACGEYGHNPITGDRDRPHYHAILFGYVPDDLKFWAKSKSGVDEFTSNFINSIWKKGFVTISLFNPAAAGYVAGYVDKKEEDESFLMMSTRPGLGADYYKQNIKLFSELDSFVSKGGFVSRLPRYFESVCQRENVDISDLKEKRTNFTNVLTMAICQEHGFDTLEQVFKYQGDKERRKKKYARNL